MDGWYRVVTKTAVFCLEVQNNTVVQAAPISKWAVGQSFPKVSKWWRSKGASLKLLRLERQLELEFP